MFGGGWWQLVCNWGQFLALQGGTAMSRMAIYHPFKGREKKEIADEGKQKKQFSCKLIRKLKQKSVVMMHTGYNWFSQKPPNKVVPICLFGVRRPHYIGVHRGALATAASINL